MRFAAERHGNDYNSGQSRRRTIFLVEHWIHEQHVDLENAAIRGLVKFTDIDTAKSQPSKCGRPGPPRSSAPLRRRTMRES